MGGWAVRTMDINAMKSLNYCKNETTEEFDNKILNQFLMNLRKFDLRTIEVKPTMAKARKRVIFGAIETRKQIELGKVKVLIIARNLSNDQLLDEDFKFCISSAEVKIIYASTRKQLGGALLNQSSRIGIVGILKLDGVYEIWNEIKEELKELQNSWIQKFENDPKLIWSCAFYGHFDLLKRIMENCKERNGLYINQACFKTGKTPLLVSVERDHLEVVKLLIENGADPDIPDFTLNRPIHLCKSEAMANLLEYIDKENASGFTAIESAVINQNIDVIKVFISKTKIDPKRLLFAATIPNSDKPISYLLKNQKFDTINHMDLLMKSVQNGSYEVFKFLISQKREIDYERRNSDDETILEISKRVGNIGISRYLGKDFNNKNK
jgi:ribosomal protein L30E